MGENAALALAALALGGGGGGFGGGGAFGGGRGRGVPQGEKECFAWRDFKNCQRGTACPFKHTGAAANPGLQGLDIKGEVLTAGGATGGPATEETFGQTLDYGGLRNTAGAAHVTIVDTKALCTHLTKAKLDQDNKKQLQFRTSAAPGHLRDDFLELARLLHPSAKHPDGTELGPSRGKKLLDTFIATLKTHGHQQLHVSIPSDATQEVKGEMAEMKDILRTVVTTVGDLATAQRAAVSNPNSPNAGAGATTPRTGTTGGEHMTPTEARRRKTPNNGTGYQGGQLPSPNSGGSAADFMRGLFADDMPAEDAPEQEPNAGDAGNAAQGAGGGGMAAGSGGPQAGAAPQGAPAPTQSVEQGWKDINTLKEALKPMMEGYSRASWAKQDIWTEDTLYSGNWEWLKPIKPLLEDDKRVTVQPTDLGLFGSWFYKADYEVAQAFVLRQLLETARGSRTPMERFLKVCATYNVVPDGRFTFNTSLLMTALIVTRHAREEKVEPWK